MGGYLRKIDSVLAKVDDADGPIFAPMVDALKPAFEKVSTRIVQSEGNIKTLKVLIIGSFTLTATICILLVGCWFVGCFTRHIDAKIALAMRSTDHEM